MLTLPKEYAFLLHRRMRCGFSLIELLVVVAIMLTISGLSLVGYNGFQERQVVNRAAANLAADLRLTQQKAISGQKSSGWCLAPATLSGWRVRFTSTTAYRIEGVCSDAATTVDKTVNLTGVISGTTPTILFTTLQGSTTTATAVVLTGTASGSTAYFKTISVTAAGSMSVQ